MGGLSYLTASRPDISYIVDVCHRFQSSPKELYLKVVKRILKYICHTTSLGIFFTKGSNMNLVGYCDADWAGNGDDKKNISGGCFFVGGNMVS